MLMNVGSQRTIIAIVVPLAPTMMVATAVPAMLASEIWDPRKAQEEDAGVG